MFPGFAYLGNGLGPGSGGASHDFATGRAGFATGIAGATTGDGFDTGIAGATAGDGCVMYGAVLDILFLFSQVRDLNWLDINIHKEPETLLRL